MTEYYCPRCKTVLEIGVADMTTENFTATVHYATCNALVGEDPNFGGGYLCEFMIARESPAKLKEELEHTCKNWE